MFSRSSGFARRCIKPSQSIFSSSTSCACLIVTLDIVMKHLDIVSFFYLKITKDPFNIRSRSNRICVFIETFSRQLIFWKQLLMFKIDKYRDTKIVACEILRSNMSDIVEAISDSLNFYDVS